MRIKRCVSGETQIYIGGDVVVTTDLVEQFTNDTGAEEMQPLDVALTRLLFGEWAAIEIMLVDFAYRPVCPPARGRRVFFCHDASHAPFLKGAVDHIPVVVSRISAARQRRPIDFCFIAEFPNGQVRTGG
jgi:hypothetical protein